MEELLPVVERGIGGHQRAFRGRTDVWLTPPEIIKELAPFDLDPCYLENPPWPTAETHYFEDGLETNWFGLVWCNPPYGPNVYKWLGKLADHGNGIALTFARTETRGFFKTVWQRADSLLFIEKRLFFYREDGTIAKSNSGGPSVLIGYGDEASNRLKSCKIEGAYINLQRGMTIIKNHAHTLL